MHGYCGSMLFIDLETGAARRQEIPAQLLRASIGGIGLGSLLLDQYCPAGADPFGPDNPLILASSPLAGTAINTSAKYAIVTRSPLTGFIGDSLSSSHLAIALKRAGLDALVITGITPAWSVLVVNDTQASLYPADDLLGLDTTTTERLVQGRYGGRVAVIGPAGEHCVRFATISNDGRQAGRTGTGAVMGAKRLKAIAIQGSQAVSVADPAGLMAVNRRLIARTNGPATMKYRQLGTPANLLTFDRVGVLPSLNFRQATFAGAEALSGERLHQEHLVGVASCASCTVGCEHLYRRLDDPNPGATRLEYETLYALGPLLGIADPNLVLQVAQQCDRLGLDTISTGGTIAWAMECGERGLLPPSDADGLELGFGRSALVPRLVEAIAGRIGFGDLLAEGSRRAAARLGGGSAAWAMHVKGLEMPGYEPRGLKTMALGLATSPRGACHNRSTAYEADFSGTVDRFQAEVGRGQLAAAAEDQAALLDSLTLCKFIRHCFDDLSTEAAELYQLVTGLPMSSTELGQAGERIINIKKRFNIRQGWQRADDCLPPRLLDEPLADGPGAGERLTRTELDLMISGYYAARGWTPDGLIGPHKLAELGLDQLT